MELLMNMTIAGTVTAAAILLIKVILKDKLTPKWHTAIWLILAVRLLVPGLPESDVSVFNAMPRVAHVETVHHAPERDSGDFRREQFVQGSITLRTPVTGTVQNSDFTVNKQFSDWMIFGWAAGMTAMVVLLTGAAAVFGRRVRKLPFCSDPVLLALFEECKREAGMEGSRVRLRMGGNTPMLLGIRKPVILIPEGYSYEELRHILLHELCHHKHKDLWINVLCCFLLSVYWFNPVLWLCFFVIRRDLEILCDYRVVEITGERKAYASVLLRTALKKNQFIFATTSMQNGEKEVAKRIRFLAHFKKPKLWVSAAAVVIILAVAALCLTNGTLSRTVVIHDAGEGYFLKIPESWEKNAVQDRHDGPESFLGYTVFYDEEGNPFGGVEMLGVDMTSYMNPSGLRQEGIPYGEIDYEKVLLNQGIVPNHSEIIEYRVIEGMPFLTILFNLDHDSETAAQEAERNDSGDMTPSRKINQTHIFLWPEPAVGRVFDLWADSEKVPEAELLEIAKTFQKEQFPRGSEADFSGDWEKTAELLLKDYFQNYVDAEMTRALDISGYTVQSLESYEDREGAWSVIYPGAAVFRVDYTLDVAYPDQHSFAGGGFEIGEGNRTKIFKGELAVFSKDEGDRAVFLGFARPQDMAGLGEAAPIVSKLNHAWLEEKAAALIDAKTPYIGDNVKVGKLIGLLPLAEYFSGMELHTKKEPYGMTVKYDLTKIGNMILENGEERALGDSRGWNVNPYIKSQLFQNAAMLLSLVDNVERVALSAHGISETGYPYTYIYNLDRAALNEKFVKDARLSTESVESYCRFLQTLEESQLYPAEDVVYRIN
ncbi:MAG TPA: M56 family metallopeptidase [Anaerovoracaceae bacterium]|nr:M56 family metallopeptidase [Anaerovoracaceae bacterium]